MHTCTVARCALWRASLLGLLATIKVNYLFLSKISLIYDTSPMGDIDIKLIFGIGVDAGACSDFPTGWPGIAVPTNLFIS